MAGTTTGTGTDCVLTPFERNRYFYGKLLTVRDFEIEQGYLNRKRYLLNRLIHGVGVVCGLETVQQGDGVTVSPGVALDSCGREIVIDQSTKIADLTTLSGYTAGLGTGAAAYLCLQYAECLREPVTALANASTCEDACEYNRIQERFAVVLTATAPPAAAAPVCADQETVVYDDGQVAIRRTTPRWVREKAIFEITLVMEAAAAHTVVVTEHLTGNLLPIRGLTPVVDHSTDWTVTLSGSGRVEWHYLVQAGDQMAHVSIGAQVQVDGGTQHNATGNSSIDIGPISQSMVEAYFLERLNTCPQGQETDCVYLAALSLDEDGKVTEVSELFPGDPYVYDNPLLYQLIACEESGRGEIPLVDVRDGDVQVVPALSTLNFTQGIGAQMSGSNPNQADVAPNLGPGLTLGGEGSDQIEVDLGRGVTFSGNHIQADLGKGLKFSGLGISANQIQADLGAGLKFDANHIAADVGNGLKLVGNQVQPDYATTATAGKVCEANDPRLSDARQPLPHAATHQNGGSDEINVTGLSGVLANPQKVTVQDDGTLKGTATILNFTGAGVAASEDLLNRRVNIEIPGSPGLTVQDDGAAKGTRPILNFTGPGASVADDAANNRVNVNIPAGGHPPYLVLRYVCGDGQQGAPGSRLSCPLTVGVEDENGLPMPEVAVVFTPQQADDQLTPLGLPLGVLPVIVTGPLTVSTDKTGAASVAWILGKETGCHRVVATLEKQPQKAALPVIFQANAVASEQPVQAWPKVSDTNWQLGGKVLLKDFNAGLTVSYTDPMDPATATLENFVVTLELVGSGGNTAVQGYHPFILHGEVKPADDRTWVFVPAPAIPDSALGQWLEIAVGTFKDPGVRCRITLKSSGRGDGIRSQDKRPLDGNDDDIKGGDFESWFYLALS